MSDLELIIHEDNISKEEEKLLKKLWGIIHSDNRPTFTLYGAEYHLDTLESRPVCIDPFSTTSIHTKHTIRATKIVKVSMPKQNTKNISIVDVKTLGTTEINGVEFNNEVILFAADEIKKRIKE